MTKPRRYGEESPLSKWIRDNPRLDSNVYGLSVSDVDQVIHRFLNHVDRIGTRDIQHILLIEEKSRNGEPSDSQSETLRFLDELLRKAGSIRTRNNRGQKVVVKYHGLHFVIYDGPTPDASVRVYWDRKAVTRTELEEVLRFERDATTLAPRSDRRHHTSPERPLFTSDATADPGQGPKTGT